MLEDKVVLRGILDEGGIVNDLLDADNNIIQYWKYCRVSTPERDLPYYTYENIIDIYSDSVFIQPNNIEQMSRETVCPYLNSVEQFVAQYTGNNRIISFDNMVSCIIGAMVPLTNIRYSYVYFLAQENEQYYEKTVSCNINLADSAILSANDPDTQQWANNICTYSRDIGIIDSYEKFLSCDKLIGNNLSSQIKNLRNKAVSQTYNANINNNLNVLSSTYYQLVNLCYRAVDNMRVKLSCEFGERESVLYDITYEDIKGNTETIRVPIFRYHTVLKYGDLFKGTLDERTEFTGWIDKDTGESIPPGTKLLITGNRNFAPVFNTYLYVTYEPDTQGITVDANLSSYDERVIANSLYTISAIQSYTDNWQNIYDRGLVYQDSAKEDLYKTKLNGYYAETSSGTSDILYQPGSNIMVTSDLTLRPSFDMTFSYSATFEGAVARWNFRTRPAYTSEYNSVTNSYNFKFYRDSESDKNGYYTLPISNIDAVNIRNCSKLKIDYMGWINQYNKTHSEINESGHTHVYLEFKYKDEEGLKTINTGTDAETDESGRGIFLARYYPSDGTEWGAWYKPDSSTGDNYNAWAKRTKTIKIDWKKYNFSELYITYKIYDKYNRRYSEKDSGSDGRIWVNKLTFST